MKNFDLSYTTTGIFTFFTPLTKAGEKAWCEIARQNEGTAKIFTVHLNQTLFSLKEAGYSVVKARTNSRIKSFTRDDDALLAELLA